MIFPALFRRLLRAHPAERGRDLWFQEEARAERMSNLLRLLYVLTWLAATGLHAPGNLVWANLSNLGMGTIWFFWSFGVQVWLLRHPYKTGYKFITTAADMLIVTATIWFCQFAAGPSFALKIPTFLNYFCCIGLVALRFNRVLAVFGGVLAVALYLMMWGYFEIHYHVIHGTNLEHTTTAKVNLHYVVFQLAYLAMFSFLTTVAAVNVKRLVKLRARETEAATRARERALVAAGVAHEIKNPLEGIYGAAQLLREEGKGDSRFIDMILADSRRLNEVAQQFLRFSRPFSARPQVFDLVAITREFCRTQSELQSGVPVEFKTGANTFEVHSDPDGIRQILLNLVQNAQRFQVEGRPIRVYVESYGEAAEVRVEDDGKGVPEDERHKLFEAFFTTSAKGTGLGLAISRKIARELGGELYFEPLEKGSRFVLIVNRHPEQEASA